MEERVKAMFVVIEIREAFVVGWYCVGRGVCLGWICLNNVSDCVLGAVSAAKALLSHSKRCADKLE